MKKARIIIIVALLGALAFFGRGMLFAQKEAVPGRITLDGNIEAEDVEVSFRMPGLIVERFAKEGEKVAAGQVVARLDSSELQNEIKIREAEIRQKNALVADLVAGPRKEEIAALSSARDAAKARLEDLLDGAKPEELRIADTAITANRAEVERLTADAQRTERLLKSDYITVKEHQAAQTALAVARERLKESEERKALLAAGPREEAVNQARALLAQAEEQLELARKGSRPDAIAQARASVGLSTEALNQAKLRLTYVEAKSPINGVVLTENAKAGEYVTPGSPVVRVADIGSVWLRGFVSEPDLGRVKLGQSVAVTTDSFPGKTYQGRLSFISNQAEFTPKNIQTEKERVRLVYRVKVDIPNPNFELKPGMPATARIDTAE